MSKENSPPTFISSRMSGTQFAVLAGLSAASASIFGKLAMDPSFIRHYSTPLSSALSPDLVEKIELGARIACFAMIFVANALMMNFFVKSMNLSNSVYATVINSSLNYFFTAVFGYVLFSEDLPPMWWLGAAFILFGVYLIAEGSNNRKEPTVKKIQ